MGVRLVPLIHIERSVVWEPTAGTEVGWRLGVWCSTDDRLTVASLLDAFSENRHNLDPNPLETCYGLHAVVQKFARGHRAVTLHDGVREWYVEVEETTP